MTMNIKNKFIELIEGSLAEAEKNKVLSEIESNPALKKEWEEYQELVNMEKKISGESHNLDHKFTQKVMSEIESKKKINFFSKLFSLLQISPRYMYAGVGGLAVIVLALNLSNYRTTVLNNKLMSESSCDSNCGKVSESEIMVQRAPADLPKLADEKLKKETLDELANKPSDTVAQGGAVEPAKQESMKVAEEKGQITTSNGIGDIVREIEPVAPLGQAKVGNDVEKKDYDFNARVSKKEAPSMELAVSADLGAAPEVAVPTGRLDGGSYEKALARGGEKYAGYQESVLTSVKDQSVSTFSVDVDTASYTNMRSYLKLGQVPPADSVRVEEYLNYFNYDYPVQYEKPFNLSYEIAPSPLEPKKYLLKLGIKAKDIRESSKPWNLVFLLDVSGSMDSPDKLDLLKKSLRILLDNMRSQDKVSIVTYSGRTETLLDGSTLKEKDKILAVVDKLYASGSTDGGSGLKDAYAVAKKNLIKEGINRIILATDGDFNVGVTDTNQIVKIVEEEAKSGVTMTTLGFGQGNINDQTMEQVANKGNGNYFYVDSLEEARRVFEKKLYGTVEVVAKDVKLQVEFNPAKVSNYRLIGYDNRVLKNEDFNNDSVDAGEIGAGHTVTALYEVILKDSEAAKELSVEHRYAENEKKVADTPATNSELAFLKIRFKGPDSNTSELLSFPIEQSNLKDKAEQASEDFRFASAVAYFGQKLRDSKYKGSYTYKDIAKLASESVGKDSEGQRREFVELVRNAELSK